MIREFDGITMRFHSLDADAAAWIKPNKHLAGGQFMNNDVLPGHTNSLRVRGASVAYPKAVARDRLHVAGSGCRHSGILAAGHDEVRRRLELPLPVGKVDVIDTLAHPIHLVSAPTEEIRHRT